MKVTRKLLKQACDQPWDVEVSWMMEKVQLGKPVC